MKNTFLRSSFKRFKVTENRNNKFKYKNQVFPKIAVERVFLLIIGIGK